MMTDKELRQWSRDNWNKIPEEKRKQCVDLLQEWIPRDTLKSIKHFGIPEFFHFSGGMAVRNKLREVMKDNELPPVEYESGSCYSNWDDYYMGAIDELLERLPG